MDSVDRLSVKSVILCLGIWNSNDIRYEENNVTVNDQSFGQGFRDYIRIKQLIKNKYRVLCIDRDHADIPGMHCEANFNIPDELLERFYVVFQKEVKVNKIVLDFLYSPVRYLYAVLYLCLYSIILII